MKSLVFLLALMICSSLTACRSLKRTDRTIVRKTVTAVKKVDQAIDDSVVGDIDRWQQENMW